MKSEVVRTQQSQPRDSKCKVVPIRPVVEKEERNCDRKYKKNENGQFLLFDVESYRQNNVIPFKPTIHKERVKRQKSSSKSKQLLLFEIEKIKVYSNSDNLWAEEFPEVASMFEQWAMI
ncbi:MAG: hypothetical protein SWX82_08625 [Cyanobacteriota bacterium]|nr:hypothetical protein [Cyanobacteriota bacterium]